MRRYKRFLVDVRLDESGSEITAHCPNPGSMMGLIETKTRAWLSLSPNRQRKLPYSLELIEDHACLVGVHTGRANQIVEEALKSQSIPELAAYTQIRREIRLENRSRLDFLLTDSAGQPCFLEVKSVTLRRDARKDHHSPPESMNGLAEFPDAPTRRGAKHLGVLGDLAQSGVRAVLLYLVQRSDCQQFSIASDLDPDYHQAASRAVKRGVEILCYACKITPLEVVLTQALPIGSGGS